MILPTKHIEPNRSLLALGAEVLILLNRPKSVSAVWSHLQQDRRRGKEQGVITYDWFILALDLLFLVDAIRYAEGSLRRNSK